MKASELIAVLEKRIEEYGDLGVHVWNYERQEWETSEDIACNRSDAHYRLHRVEPPIFLFELLTD